MSLITIGLHLAIGLGYPGLDSPNPEKQAHHEVLVHRVTPSGQVQLMTKIPGAAVPTLCRMEDGSIILAHQWFPEDIPGIFDHIAVQFSNDEGRTWTGPTAAEIPGLPARTRFPFDPSIVKLPDGRLRMYFTVMQGNDTERSTPAIGSSISTNGINWTFERGDRFSLPGTPVMNCAIAPVAGGIRLIAPMQPGFGEGAYAATSRDGLVFSQNDNLPPMGSNKQWLGCLLQTDEALRFYGTSGPNGATEQASGIWTADLQSNGEWTLGPSLDVPGSDPGVIRLDDGTLLVATTKPMSSDDSPDADTDIVQEIDQPASRKDIDKHLDHLVESSNQLDWNRFANTFAPTATGFLSTPSRVQRLENGTAVVNAFKPTFTGQSISPETAHPLPEKPKNLDIHQDGNTAIATFQTDHEDDHKGWWTVVMRRTDAQSDWKVHHIHTSVQSNSSTPKSSWP